MPWKEVMPKSPKCEMFYEIYRSLTVSQVEGEEVLHVLKGLLRLSIFSIFLAKGGRSYMSWRGFFDYPSFQFFGRIRSDHNEDNTSQILHEWTQNVKHLYHRVLINTSNTPSQYDDAVGPGQWSETRYRQMMYLRQRALDSARKQWADYLFVCNECNI